MRGQDLAQVPGVHLSDVHLPVGTIIPFAGRIATADTAGDYTTPTQAMGWLLCDGRPLEIIDYPELFSALGYLYGGAQEQFKLPDLRGQFLRGVGTSAGSLEGRAAPGDGDKDGVGSTQTDALQTHEHTYSKAQDGGNGGKVPGVATAVADQNTSPPVSTPSKADVSVSDFETRPTNVFVNYLIKYTYQTVQEATP